MTPPNKPKSVSAPPKAEGVETQKEAAETIFAGFYAHCKIEDNLQEFFDGPSETWGRIDYRFVFSHAYYDPYDSSIEICLRDDAQFDAAKLMELLAKFGLTYGWLNFDDGSEAHFHGGSLGPRELKSHPRWSKEKAVAHEQADGVEFPNLHPAVLRRHFIASEQTRRAADSVRESNEASPPPSNPKETTVESVAAGLKTKYAGLAAATEEKPIPEWIKRGESQAFVDHDFPAEDVAEELWTAELDTDGDWYLVANGKSFVWCADATAAKLTESAHNSCVSRLQQQIKADQEKISELSTKVAMAARLQRLTEDNQVRALDRADSLQRRAEEAEAKIAAYENRKPSTAA